MCFFWSLPQRAVVSRFVAARCRQARWCGGVVPLTRDNEWPYQLNENGYRGRKLMADHCEYGGMNNGVCVCVFFFCRFQLKLYLCIDCIAIKFVSRK